MHSPSRHEYRKIIIGLGFGLSFWCFRTLQTNVLRLTKSNNSTSKTSCKQYIDANNSSYLSDHLGINCSTAVITQPAVAATPPPQRYQVGTWVGKWWIPPPEWKLFSPDEMVQL